MHGHLVTVKVGVKRSTNKWMKLDRLAFDKHGLRLNTQPMQSWRPIHITGCSRITSSRMSHTSGLSFSTMRLAIFTVLASE